MIQPTNLSKYIKSSSKYYIFFGFIIKIIYIQPNNKALFRSKLR